VTFFFDAHFSPRLCDALAALGIDAHHVRRELGDAAGDPGWIGLAGERSWVIVTCDFKIRTRQAEREALRQAGVSMLFVRQAALFRSNATLQMGWFCQHHARIVQAIEAAPRGTHVEIGVRGGVKRLPGLG
jgi:predicted nuclease of predicted toxin-antitoxin system